MSDTASRAGTHPSPDLLLDYATGGLDLPARVLLAAHIARCERCKVDLERLRAPGAGYLRSLDDSSGPSRVLWQRLQAAIVNEEPARARDGALKAFGIPLPGAAWAELGPRRPLEWRSLLARGIQWASVGGDPDTGSALVAVKAAKRTVLPAHEHTRVELGVILEGGFADHVGDYDLGDFFTYEAGTAHRPRMDPTEGCIALIRLEAPNRFLGWRGWIFR